MNTDQKQRYVVSGVCCSTEESVLRKALDATIGNGRYEFSVVSCELRVDPLVHEDLVLDAVRRAGFRGKKRGTVLQKQSFWERHGQSVVFSAASLLALGGGVAEQVGAGEVVTRVLLGVAITVGGWPVFHKALGALMNRVLDMNVLMSLAVIGALAIDRWTEGAAVVLLFALSLLLESYSFSRTRRAVQSLIALSPPQASVLRGGHEEVIAAEDVAPGEDVLIRPGERVPLDGVVVEGNSTVNQSAITGESTRVSKAPGDSVFAGTLNERGALTIRTTKRFEDTTLARIIHLVEEAEHKRAPIQRFVDRFARVYTPVVLGLALLTAIIPPVIFGAVFLDWLYRALVLLVIACPCALVISTPVTIVSAVTNAARHGILIKGGNDLETLGTVRAVAFDKTGTLTEGNIRVTDIIALNGSTPEEILRITVALEQRSEHHLAVAVLEEAQRRGIHMPSGSVRNFEAIPGRGIQGRFNGVTYFAGNRELCEDRGILDTTVREAVDRLTQEGKTVIVVGTDGKAVGIVALSDVLRTNARIAVARLRTLGIRHTVLLSGDHERVVAHIARDAGMTEWVGGLLPEEKKDAIEKLKLQHGDVAMVGDGINDAPALAASSVGIAMGAVGSDTALETADVVLMSDELGRLPHLFTLGRKSLSIIRQNIILALLLKGLFLILGATGLATLWMAVLADDGAALLVILNGLRLLGYKGPENL